jgi:lipopolysaccharide transport system permease protein
MSITQLDSAQPDPEPVPAAAVEVTYSPGVQKGFGRDMWREMYVGFIGSRELTWRLFLRDFSARYRQSFLGYVWAVLPTIVTVVMFVFLSRSQILPIGATTLPYPLYVLVGMTVWLIFSAGITRTTNSLVAAGNLITKVNFPRETVVLAAFLDSLLELFIRFWLVVAMFLWYREVPCWGALAIPLVLIPLMLMTLGIGFALAAANAVLRDIGTGLGVVMTFAMFLTPVVYPPPTRWPLTLINYVNPVSPFLIAVQDLLAGRELSQPLALACASSLAVLVFVLGWRAFHLALARIVERI